MESKNSFKMGKMTEEEYENFQKDFLGFSYIIDDHINSLLDFHPKNTHATLLITYARVLLLKTIQGSNLELEDSKRMLEMIILQLRTNFKEVFDGKDG